MMAVMQIVTIRTLPCGRELWAEWRIMVLMFADDDFGLLDVLRIDFGAEDRAGANPLDRDDFAVRDGGNGILVVSAGQRRPLVDGKAQIVTLGQQDFRLAATLARQGAGIQIVRIDERGKGAVVERDLV